MAAWAERIARIQASGQRVFAEAATYFPSVGNPVAIRGIFDANSAAIQVVDGIEVETTVPILTVHLVDIPGGPETGTKVLVRNEMYQVVLIKPDGQGDADLIFEDLPA